MTGPVIRFEANARNPLVVVLVALPANSADATPSTWHAPAGTRSAPSGLPPYPPAEECSDRDKAELAKLKADNEELKAKNEELKADNEKLRYKNDGLEHTINTRSDELDAVTKLVEDLKAQAEGLMACNDKMRAEAEELKAENERLQDAKNGLEHTIDTRLDAAVMLTDTVRELAAEVDTLAAEFTAFRDNTQESLTAHDIETVQLGHALSDVRADVKNTTKRMNDICSRTTDNASRSDLRAIQDRLLDLEVKLHHLCVLMRPQSEGLDRDNYDDDDGDKANRN